MTKKCLVSGDVSKDIICVCLCMYICGVSCTKGDRGDDHCEVGVVWWEGVGQQELQGDGRAQGHIPRVRAQGGMEALRPPSGG